MNDKYQLYKNSTLLKTGTLQECTAELSSIAKNLYPMQVTVKSLFDTGYRIEPVSENLHLNYIDESEVHDA